MRNQRFSWMFNLHSYNHLKGYSPIETWEDSTILVTFSVIYRNRLPVIRTEFDRKTFYFLTINDESNTIYCCYLFVTLQRYMSILLSSGIFFSTNITQRSSSKVMEEQLKTYQQVQQLEPCIPKRKIKTTRLL